MVFAGLSPAATITVTNNLNIGPGSLRRALFDVMTSGVPRNIKFAITPTGGTVHAISLSPNLPDITNSVFIDGFSQPGYSNRPLIKLVSAGAIDGLTLYGGSNVVRGLEISGFTNIGIRIQFYGESIVESCYLLSNYLGVAVWGIAHNTVGGDSVSKRNVISANYIGVDIGFASDYNYVAGNYIGVGPSGTGLSLSNRIWGVYFSGGSSNIVRGSPSAPQIISGNGSDGILFDYSAHDNRVEGNYVGVDSSGSNAIPNYFGITSRGAKNIIGGTAASNRNIISGNPIAVHLTGSASYGHLVAGNYIGVDASGLAAVSGSGGIDIRDASSNNLVTGSAAAPQIMAGCEGAGVFIYGSGSDRNLVAGNSIGLGTSGAVITNGSGVTVIDGKFTQIGGTNAVDRNMICGSSGCGVTLGGASHTTVQGNFIGVDSNGTIRPNGFAGVWIIDATNNFIAGNVISGNQEEGVRIEYNSKSNTIRGNFIGPTPVGGGGAGNARDGIYILGTSYNFIGGTNAGDGNVIAYNNGGGITLVSNAIGGITRTRILGNLIYSNALSSIDLNDDGFTTNDPAPDVDAGANNNLNFPVVTNALQGSTAVQGFFISGRSQPYTLEFFASPVTNEGQVFLGRTNLALDASGTGNFSFVFSTSAPTGWVVSATATDTNGLTSELNTIGPGGIVQILVDGDGDGLWDSWELTDFGNTTNFGDGDNDGDGFNNYVEFISDTSPTNPASFFQLVSLTNGLPHYPGWISSAARRYDVEASTNQLASTWEIIGTNLAGVDGVQTLADEADPTSRFYRVRVKLP